MGEPENNDIRCRAGKIPISKRLMINDRDCVINMFHDIGFLPNDTDHSFLNVIHYYGTSPEFEKVEEGCEMPIYRPVFDDDLDKWVVRKE